MFVVVNGVPSVGVKVMLGSGAFGEQTIHEVEALPASSVVTATADTNNHPRPSSAGRTTPALVFALSLLAAVVAPLF